MLRVIAAVLTLSLGACAPAPAHMAASQASEVLERFAAGVAPMDVCTPSGRAMLRGAVRAYGAEMARAGLTWPQVPGPGVDPASLKRMDIAVMIAFGAGFVEGSDFRGRARPLIGRMTLTQWPEIRDMRAAARTECRQVVALQQAAARFVIESERYQGMRAEGGEGLERQAMMLLRARREMETLAAQAGLSVGAGT